MTFLKTHLFNLKYSYKFQPGLLCLDIIQSLKKTTSPTNSMHTGKLGSLNLIKHRQNRKQKQKACQIISSKNGACLIEMHQKQKQKQNQKHQHLPLNHHEQWN